MCPKKCGSLNFCGVGRNPKIARAGLHFFEEPPVSGTKGSGTVFFSGCNLSCVYCQNYEISSLHKGIEISIKELAQIYRDLELSGAHNINLVNPSHYTAAIIASLKLYRPKIPIVYNTSSYESPASVRAVKDYVDVYLADLKYLSRDLSLRYSGAADYFEVASKAILSYALNAGENIFEDGIIKRGVIIRHLVLPGCYNDSIKLLDWIKQNLPKGTLLSLMSQYTPYGKAADFPEINRRLTTYEYNKVLYHAQTLGIDGYSQSRDSAGEKYIPVFYRAEINSS